MKKVLIISFSPLHRDPRILRQIKALKDMYMVTALGYTNPEIKGVEYIHLEQVRYRTVSRRTKLLLRVLFRQFETLLLERGNTKALLHLDLSEPTVIIANDWTGLFLAEKLMEAHQWKSKIYFDAHEYSPKESETISWKLIFKPQVTYVLRTCMTHVAAMTTVSEGIAHEYEKYLSFSPGFIKVITNAPDYEPALSPIPLEKMQTVTHGNLAPSKTSRT